MFVKMPSQATGQTSTTGVATPMPKTHKFLRGPRILALLETVGPLRFLRSGDGFPLPIMKYEAVGAGN